MKHQKPQLPLIFPPASAAFPEPLKPTETSAPLASALSHFIGHSAPSNPFPLLTSGVGLPSPSLSVASVDPFDSLHIEAGDIYIDSNNGNQATMAARSMDTGAGAGNAKAAAATGASDFVKKLYNMLEDGAHNNIVSWSAKGDTFVVKDMNEFTRTILPKHFKHSNFASFVRQLNKYDFHKVKNPESTESGVYGDHTWEFCHPSFRSDMKGELEQIKRKGPAPRKPGTSKANANASRLDDERDERLLAMQQQIDLLASDQHNLIAHVGNLSRDYHASFNDVLSIRRSLNGQDVTIQKLISYIVASEKNKARNEGRIVNNDESNFVLSPDAQALLNAYHESSRTVNEKVDEAIRRPSQVTGRALNAASAVERLYPVGELMSEVKSSPSSHSPSGDTPQFYEADNDRNPLSRNQPPPVALPHATASTAPGSVGPTAVFAPTALNGSMTAFGAVPQHAINAAGSQTVVPQGVTDQRLTSTYHATWTAPPKILLVEDDAVCRKISSKFLEVFGCQIDVATDGVSAVNKMNVEKYDLVFMDIMMPHLDGVSATSLIRQFDPMTPIISMTSNSNPQEILTYFSHGMNDILPKPFTKEGLLGMLDKHLLHLKQMQYLSEIPRVLGIPDDAIQDAIVSTFVDPSANNPFAEMVADIGHADNDYVHHLASLVNGGSNSAEKSRSPLKRGHSDAMLAGPMTKRNRLEEQ